MENTEEVLMALGQFEKEPASEIPQLLEDYLNNIAKTGYTMFPWARVKPLFKVKLENVIADFLAVSPVSGVPVMPNVEQFKFEEMKTRIWEQFESYNGIPFTIQRLCELLTQPMKNYKRIDKFLRGLERVMLVVSTIDPKPLPVGDRSGISNGFSLESASILSQDFASGSGDISSRLKEGVAASKPDNSEDTEPGSRRLGDSLESPAKRMRLSIEEDGGPCDSADQLPLPTQESSPTGNECIPAAGPLAEPVIPSTSAASADSSPQEGEGSGESMEIDTECTSSQARLELSTGEKSGEPSKAVDEADGCKESSSEAAPEDSAAAEMNAADSGEPAAVAKSVAASDSAAVEEAAAAPADNAAVDSAVNQQQGGAAIEQECEAEEGISTSGELGPASHISQVDTNSEAEASGGAEQVEGVAEEPKEDQHSVGSSQPNSELRTEETVGVADSSDEAEQPRSAPMDTAEAEADQSAEAVVRSSQAGELDNSPDQSV